MIRLAVPFLFLTISTTVFAQDDGAVVLPDNVMRQVVSRIMTWNFKPSRKQRTVLVGDDVIKPDWLPAIKNISFEVVPDIDVINYENGVYFFKPVERDGTAYTIDFGRGDLDCDATGDTWKFTVRKGRVRLWRTGEGWGQACGTAPPVASGLKVGDVSPNELPGYQFFAKGKLKEIRLGHSTREDMKRIFGDTCDGSCDYDENWEIWVNYFEDENGRYAPKSDGEFDFIAKPEFVGKLRFVTLMPKGSISFSKVIFPRSFERGVSTAIGDDFGPNGFEGAVHSALDVYTDGYGLQYSVYEKETFNNTNRTEKSKAKRGDLVLIEYEIPDSLDDVVYNKRPKKA